MTHRGRAGWMLILRVSITILVACSFSGCGPNKPNIDEDAALRSVGFYDPIVVSVPLNTTDGLFALFRKAGYVAIIPNTASTPWWSFGDSSGSPIAGSPIQMAVGHRV